MEEEEAMRRLVILTLFVLAALAIQAQVPLWQYNSPSPIIFEPTLGGDGSVYFATADGKLRALNSKGVQAWAVNPGAVLVTPIALQSGTLYFATANQEVRAYSVAGNLQWRAKVDKNVVTPLAVTGGGQIVFAIQTGDVYGLRGADGHLLWKQHFGAAVGPVTVGHDGTAFFAADDFVNAVNPATGQVRWRKNFFNFSNVPIVLDGHDDLFYIRGGILDVYDFDGNFLWEARDAQGNLLTVLKKPPVIHGDLLIVADNGGGDFYGMDVHSGDIVWQFSNVNSNWSPSVASSVAVDRNGTVAYSDGTGVLAWFDGVTGQFYGYMPSIGVAGDANLVGDGLKGTIVLRTGAGQSSLVAYRTFAGPSPGPWGQAGGSARRLQRRDDPPAIDLISPMDGALISGIFNTHAEATDDFSLNSLALYLNDTQVAQSGNGSLTWSVDSKSFQDGVYTLTILAKDSGGNESTATATITVSNPAPVYSIFSAPPLFSWLSNGIDNKYQVTIAADPGFTSVLASSSREGKKWLKGTSWQAKDKDWRSVLDRARVSPTDQTTFYWRVVGKRGGVVMTKTFIIDRTM
jgi:hypothetical protein